MATTAPPTETTAVMIALVFEVFDWSEEVSAGDSGGWVAGGITPVVRVVAIAVNGAERVYVSDRVN